MAKDNQGFVINKNDTIKIKINDDNVLKGTVIHVDYTDYWYIEIRTYGAIKVWDEKQDGGEILEVGTVF